MGFVAPWGELVPGGGYIGGVLDEDGSEDGSSRRSASSRCLKGRCWLWTLIALLALGGGVTTAVLTTRGSNSAASNSVPEVASKETDEEHVQAPAEEGERHNNE